MSTNKQIRQQPNIELRCKHCGVPDVSSCCRYCKRYLLTECLDCHIKTHHPLEYKVEMLECRVEMLEASLKHLEEYLEKVLPSPKDNTPF